MKIEQQQWEQDYIEKSIENITQILCGIGINHTNRFSKFLQIQHKLNDVEYWSGLALAYTASDYLDQYNNEVVDCFLSERPCKEFLMTDDEHAYLKTLPDEIIVYRGMSVFDDGRKDNGISWSFDHKVAEYFATSYRRIYNLDKGERMIEKRTISKSDVIAYFDSRNEKEIIHIIKK